MEKEEFLYQRPDEGLSHPVEGLTSLKFVNRREQVTSLYKSRFGKIVRTSAKALALSGLLAAWTIYTMQNAHGLFTRPALAKLPGAVISARNPSQDPFQISQVLRRYTNNGEVADRIAKAVVSEGRKKHIDPALLVGVMLVESDNLNPHARSVVGARGLMQVMPFHRGQWGCQSRDLYSIEGNICHGVSVLADAIKHAPNLRVALQRYNGCVRGTNTPGCSSYSGKVLRAADKTQRELWTASESGQTTQQ
jgi:soluble lytic murein transglycosylase-like protein